MAENHPENDAADPNEDGLFFSGEGLDAQPPLIPPPSAPVGSAGSAQPALPAVPPPPVRPAPNVQPPLPSTQLPPPPTTQPGPSTSLPLPPSTQSAPSAQLPLPSGLPSPSLAPPPSSTPVAPSRGPLQPDREQGAVLTAHDPPRDDLVVHAQGLTKRYGGLVALDNLSLEIPRGSIFGMIGPNGAGKSTTFLILATLLIPSYGSARVCGYDPVREPREVRRRIGYMPDVMGVYDNLTVAEYLEFHAAAYNIPSSDWQSLTAGLLELVDLDVKRNTHVNDLSRGMKQRLSLARAMVHDPELLILDEPASGLDPRARIDFRNLLLQLQSMGKTILISSHILAELQQMCNQVSVIEAGRLLAAGSPNAILGQLGAERAIKVTFADGSTEEFPVADDAAQQQLLRELVSNDAKPVMEFTSTSHDLEDLFLQITEGIVQ